MTVVSHKSVISPILVGRKSELDLLDGLLEQSRQGHGQLALVVGEAGIGKSRLVAEVKRKAKATGCWVLEGHCDEPDQLIPYAPLLELLRRHLNDPATGASGGEVGARFGSAAAVISKFFPELDWPSVAGEAGFASWQGADQEKRLLYHGLTRYVQDLGAQRPVFLIVEDLHWSDDATLEFLTYLLRHLPDHPILLLFTYRGDEIGAGLARFLAAVERRHIAVEVALTPLTMDQVDQMMRAIFELARPIRNEFLQAVSDLTEGNPFFIEETLKALLAVGDIYYGEKAWDRRPMGELHIPRTVSDAVQRRAANLSAPAQQLLLLAAVAGRRFDVAVLQVVTQQDEQTLLASLKELVAAQLIVEAGADEFAFRHALTQQALYTKLLGRERQAMHRSLAQTLAQRHQERIDANVAELAYHSHAGGAWADALHYARRAGEQAQQLYLPQAAIKQYSRALEAASHLSPTPLSAVELASIYRARGLAYETVGSFEQAQGDLKEALALVAAAPDRQMVWEIEWQLLLDLGFLWASRDYGQAGEYYQQALALAQRLEAPNLLAHSFNRVGNWQLNRGDAQAALDAYQQSLAIFETVQDRRGLAQTLDLMAMASGQMGDVACIGYYEQAATIFRELDDRVGLVSVLAMLGPLRFFMGSAEGAEKSAAQSAENFAEALEVAQRIGYQSGEAFLVSEYAQVLAWRGEYGEALLLAQRGFMLAQEIDHYQWLSAASSILGLIYLDLMAYEPALLYLEQTLTLAQEISSQIFVEIGCAALALLYLELNQADEAQRVLEMLTVETPVSFYDHIFWYARIRLALWRKQPALVLQLLGRCRPAFFGAEHDHWINLNLRQAQGEALAALGDPKAEELFRSVCELAPRKGLRPLLWRGRVILGNYLMGKNRQEEAAREFAVARAIIEELTATLDDEALAASFRQRALATMPVPTAPTARQAAKRAFDGLTAAEQQVAALVAQGKSNRAIAIAQVVSIKTVEAHISHILSKLGFSSRAQIAVWAVEKGLVASLASEEDAS